MKKKSILCSIFTCLMMLFSVMGFAQVNTNGGFESWTGTWPDGWHGSKTNITADKVVLVTTGAHSGNNACQLIVDTTKMYRFTMQPVSVNVGEQYIVSFWVKGQGEIRAGLYNGGNTYNYLSYHEINNAQYVYCEDTITVGNTDAASEFILGVKNTVATSGHLIVDDVTVTMVVADDFVAEPVATITGNLVTTDTYVASATVSLSTVTEGASIYYTLDGSEPSSSSTEYNAPFTITETSTLNAIAVLGENSSEVLTKTITIVDFNPLFFEDFESNTLNEMTVQNIYGAVAWNVNNHQGNHYAYANAYNQGATETWLITPAITPLNAGGVILSFITARNYIGPDILVKYSTDYSGTGSPAAATWTDITNECVLSTGTSWAWAESGDIEIPGAAPIYFAWVYTSEESLAAGWEVDNIMVMPGSAPVNTPTLAIIDPANGSNFSTLDTLPVNIDIQNFTLGTDGYLKVESPLLTAINLPNPSYLDLLGLAVLQQFVISPLPAGTHTVTCSLVDMDHAALNPAVTAATTFTVTAPVLAAPILNATGDEAEGENTFYFNATVSMTAAVEGASIYYTTDGTEPTENSSVYAEPLQITETTTVKAIAMKVNYANSEVSTLTVTITAPTVETPVFNPVPGAYADSVVFSIACETEGAEIHYTLDGTDPTETSTLYSTPVTLTATTTVKAKAFKTDWFASEIATAVYTVVYDPILTVDVTTLNFSSTQLSQTFMVGGAHLDEAIVITCDDAHFTVNPTNISNPNSNTMVTVTFDGTEPATGNITVTSDTLSAQIALVATAKLPVPILTPANAEDTIVTITISCSVADAEIFYTTNGIDPAHTYVNYFEPIVLNTPGTYIVNAFAMKDGWETSNITSGTYIINEPPAPDTVSTPVITPVADTYYEPQTVTITCADADAVIRYTLDGTEPTETAAVYSQPFTVNTTTTVTAKAWKTNWVPSATASITISFPDQVANIAAFKDAAETDVEKQIMSDVTFVFRSGRFMFVEDNTGALLIYDYSTPVITTNYNEGDVIEGGIFGKYTVYQGMVEMLPTHDANIAMGEPVTVTPVEATITDIKAQYTDVYESKLVHLSDVQFITDLKFVQDGDTMAIFNRFNTVTTTIGAGDIADVTGFVSYSTQHGYQIYPRGNNDIEIHPVVVMDTVATPEFEVFKDGELYRVNITCATEDATIYYTINGENPDESSYLFDGFFPLYFEHHILKAVAMKEGMVNSAIAVYDFDPSGVPAYDLRNNVRVYPNPATDYVHVESADITIQKVELYNMYGQLLRTVEVTGNAAELSVGNLATGTYFAKVFTEAGVSTMPVIRK